MPDPLRDSGAGDLGGEGGGRGGGARGEGVWRGSGGVGGGGGGGGGGADSGLHAAGVRQVKLHWHEAPVPSAQRRDGGESVGSSLSPLQMAYTRVFLSASLGAFTE